MSSTTASTSESTSASTYAIGGLPASITLSEITGSQIANASSNSEQISGDVTTLSTHNTNYQNVASALQSLMTALPNFEDGTQVGGLSASSNNSAIGVTLGSDGVAGTYSVNVSQVAQAQINDSKTAISATSAALFGTGTLGIQVGSGSTVSVSITNTMTLSAIATAINNANAGVTASVVASGSNYMVQVVGNNIGAANAVTYTENGTSTGIASGKVQSATNAAYTVNGQSFSSTTNTAVNGVPGATLTFSTSPASATITVAASASAVVGAVGSLISDYNAVVTAINTAIGASPSGNDVVLQTLNKQLNRLVSDQIAGSTGTFRALVDLGIVRNNDGTLSVNTNALSASASQDAGSITTMIAGLSNYSSGLAAGLNAIAAAFAEPGVGVFDRVQTGLSRSQLKNARALSQQQYVISSTTQAVNQQYSALQVNLSYATLDSLVVQNLATQAGITTGSTSFSSTSSASG